MSVSLCIFYLIVFRYVFAYVQHEGWSNPDESAVFPQFLLRELLSPNFLEQLDCARQYSPELNLQRHSEKYNLTIFELKEITADIPFQAFLKRLSILRAVKASEASQSAKLLLDEYSSLSMRRARLTGRLNKLRIKHDLAMYQQNTIQRELEHIEKVQKQITFLDQEKKSRLSSYLSLRSKIQKTEFLISQQESLLADRREKVKHIEFSAPKPAFRYFRSWSGDSSDEELLNDEALINEIATAISTKESKMLISEAENDNLSENHSRELAKLTSPGSSRSQSIINELRSIYSFNDLDDTLNSTASSPSRKGKTRRFWRFLSKRK